MAHTNVANTYVARGLINGGIYRLDQTLTLPTTVDEAVPQGAVLLGGISDDGITVSSERTSEKKKDFTGGKVRSIQTDKDDTIEVTFIEFLNPNVLEVIHGKVNVTVTPATEAAGTLIVTKNVADVLDHGAFVLDSHDGLVQRRRCLPDAQPSKIDPVVEKPGDWSVYKVTFDLFPDSQGVTLYTYTQLNDKLDP